MAASFFFYDLETSGFSPREARIMQFAGQRTDSDLQPIGEPVNVLIKLAADVLPDPDAVMLTGITPQTTISEGLTEAEFLHYFYETVVQPETTFLGYNSVRFDDEFMRFLHYRNFYDAYEWQWCDGCSRWDILDLVRMTRALRPEGIEWPVTDDGKPTNRLELLTKVNKLDHDQAHDALSDVKATIAVAQLIKQKQPDLFKYLFEGRGKKKVMELVLQGSPFIYTSGRYPSQTWHTTAGVLLAKHPGQDAALVYDLRHDPTHYFDLSPEQLAELWRYHEDKSAPRLPVKTLKYNRCPAVAPLGVIKADAVQQRLDLPLATVSQHFELFKKHHQEFATKVLQALLLLDEDRERSVKRPAAGDVDGQLYDGFLSVTDKTGLRQVRDAPPDQLTGLAARLHDDRLKQLLPLYKARNYPASLSGDERAVWDQHVRTKLFAGGKSSRLANYFNRLQTLAAGTLTSNQEYLLEELQLYGESIMPADSNEE